MSDKTSTPPGFSLRRWSQKKAEATRTVPDAAPPVAGVPAAVPATDAASATSAATPTPPAPLPPVESLTIDSDFRAFFGPKVDEGLRRQALKQLFRDPHFNAMDGLDVYIGDYTIADPIAPDVVRTMVQSRYIFDPPKTRVNTDGVVEDVPPDGEVAATNVGESDVPPRGIPGATQPPPTTDRVDGDAAVVPPPDGSEPVSR
jgi:hypothetical protein